MVDIDSRKKALNELRRFSKENKYEDMFEYLRLLMGEESIESMFKRFQKNAGLGKDKS